MSCFFKTTAALSFLVSISIHASAATTFQGIYRLTQSKAAVGILIAKKESLPNGNQKVTAHFATGSSGDYDLTVMEVDSGLRPVSFSKTSKQGANLTKFTSTIKGDTYTTTKSTESTTNSNVKASSNLTVKIPTPSHFSFFLPDVMKSKGLLSARAKMTGVLLTEDPGVQVVDAVVGPEETINGVKVKPITLSPKDLSPGFTFYMTDTLEPARISVGTIVADLSPSLAEAAKGLAPVDEAKLATMMGGPVKNEHKIVFSAPAAAPAPAKK